MRPAPPTIAHLKSHGLEGLFVTCTNAACLHSAPFKMKETWLLAINLFSGVILSVSQRANCTFPASHQASQRETGTCGSISTRVVMVLGYFLIAVAVGAFGHDCGILLNSGRWSPTTISTLWASTGAAPPYFEWPVLQKIVETLINFQISIALGLLGLLWVRWSRRAL